MIVRVLRGFVLAIATVASAAGAVQAQTPVAIVVHPNTPVENLSLTQLRNVFLGEQQFWGDNSRITLLVRAPASAEREFVLKRIYRMNEGQFRQYWIAKLFRAEVASGPKIVYSSEMALELVTAIPGAITFLPANAIVSGAKVVRVDGKLPNDPGYPLK
jgi:ABC-type phosphate transport system substrate-binding protein